ncbi:MAG: phage tail tape measure protein [Corynebacterium glutamicum]|nr:phage tail tape measure protein [Corynebacterium glutamicum]
MSVVGFGSIPVIPSLDGITKTLERQLSGPLSAAAKKAGGEFEQILANSAEQAAKKVELARKREVAAAAQVEAAERKILSAKDDVEAATKRASTAEKQLNVVRGQQSLKVEDAERKLEALRSSGTATADQLKRAEDDLRITRQKADVAIEKQEAAVEAARKKVDTQTQKVESAETGLKDARRQAADATDNVVAAEKRLQDEQGKAEKSTVSLRDRIKEAGDEAYTTGGLFDGLVGKIGGVAALAAGALGVTGGMSFLSDAISQGRELDTVMGSLQAVSQSTEAQMAAVSERARDLGADETLASTSAASATEAMLSLAQGGMSVSDAMEAAKGSIQLAGAAQIDAGQAASIQISQLNSFGLAADEATRVADVLANASNNSATSVVELGEALKMTSPTASTLGISLEDTNTMLGLFANNGVKGSEAGTAMRSALLSITAPTKQAAKAFEEMGVEAFDSEGRFVGLSEVSRQLAAAQERMGESAYLGAAATAFGREAIGFATTAASGGAEAFDELRAAMDRQGTAGETAGAKLAGMNGALDRFENGLDDAKLRVYELISPLLTEWIDKAAGGLDSLAESFEDTVSWMTEHKDLLIVIGGVAGGVVTGLLALKAVQAGLWAVGAISTFARTLAAMPTLLAAQRAGTLTATAAQLGLNGALAANPIGAVVIAITAVVGALVVFFTKTETGREMWSKFTTAIVDGWNWTTEKLGAGVQWIQDKFSAFTGWISDAWSGITSLFKGDFTAELRESFGVEEDNPLISGFLKAHEILTGIPKLITGITDILFKGEFSGMPFGLEEDSGIVNFFFTIREAVIKTGEIISAVWDGIVTVGKWAFAIIATIVITPLILYWNLLSSAVKLGYEKVILPTFTAFAALGQWLWGSALKPAFAGISSAWSSLGDALATGWAWIDENVIQPVVAGFEWLGEMTLAVFDFLAEKWQITQELFAAGWAWIDENMIQPFMTGLGWLGDKFAEVIAWIGDQWNLAQMLLAAGWLWIDGNVFQLFRDGAQWVGEKFQQVVDGIGLAWEATKLTLYAGWLWIDQNVFSIFRLGVELMKSATETAMSGIGLAFDWLREKTATPINFVIREIYMGGIREAWGAVARLVDLPELPEIQEIKGYRSGGILPGYSRMADGDDQLVPMRRGEGVLVSEGLRDRQSRELFLSANEQAKRGKSFAGFLSDFVAGYAGGGVIGSLNSIKNAFYPELSLTSGHRPGDSGYHGTAQAADFSNTGAGMPSTPAMQAFAKFMYGNYGDQLEQLIHHPARNIGSGKDVGDGFGYYGAGTMYGHTDHVHLAALRALVDPSGVVQMEPYDGEGGGFSLSTMVKSLWDSAIGKIGSFTDGAGIMAELPAALLSKMATSAWEYISGLVGKFFGSAGSIGDAESWRDMAKSAMRRNGFNADDEAQVNAMLSQIMSESGGNPGIAQQIVDINGTGDAAGVGLLQIIPGTFAAHRDPDLPNDRRDAWANMNAALRYYKSRYGMDLTTMWGHGHGYAMGGIFDAPHVGIYDTGGVLPKGGVAVNTSAFDEVIVNGPNLQAINNLANNVGVLVQKLSRDGDVDAFAAALAKELDPVVVELQRLADPSTVEGMTIRSVADRVLGMDLLPYGNVVETIMSAETDLLNARSGHADRLQAILDKEKALKDAQAELDALLSDESGMSVQNQRKLADAEKALEKAKADAAEASAEKQSAAAEKVANAEEKLSRVREDIAASAEEDAEKRDEDIVKATDAVSKAESELVSARQESVKQLDHIMLPETVGGLIPQIGQAASALSGVLPEVSAGLSGLAATALPAGVSLGMAMAAVQVALDVAREIWDAIDEFIEHLNAIRIFEAEGWAKTFASIHEWTRLVEGQRQAVSALQQDLINAQIALTSATWDVRVAQFDQMRAQLEGVKNVATAQAALDAERERAARQALWDSGALNDAFDRYRWAQKVGWEDLLRDAVVITPEILALQHELNATKLLAEAANLEAAKNTLTAIHQMNLASINLGRTQAKLLDQQELLAQMEGTNYGLSGEESRVMSELADIMADNAKLEADRNSLGNTVKDALGTGLSFLTFGLFGNDLKNTQDSFDEAIRANNARIDRIMGQYKDLISEEDFKEMQKAMERAKAQYALGNTAGAEAILRGEVLGRAEQATRDAELDRDIYDWRQEQEDLRNSIEDTQLDLDYQTKLQEYIEKIFALESGAASEQYSADAIRESNPVVKAALEELAEREANIAQSVVEKQPVNITLTGDAISTDKVRELLEELNTRSDDLDIRVTQLEEPEEDDLMDAINSRRTY